jgi:ABC-type glycerol-3-phosphate transport system substrate-binding protein
MRIVPLLVALALLAAGCGSSKSHSSSTSSTTTTVPAPTNTTIAAAVKACKASINSQSISATVRAQLNTICDEAGAGNQNAVKKATSEVCIEVVKESVPAAQQATAEASCPRP